MFFNPFLISIHFLQILNIYFTKSRKSLKQVKKTHATQEHNEYEEPNKRQVEPSNLFKKKLPQAKLVINFTKFCE